MGIANQAVFLYGEYDLNLYVEEFPKRLSSGTIIDEEVKEKEDEDKNCLKSGKTEEPENSLNTEYHEELGRMAKWNHKVLDGSPDWSIPLIPERDENLCSSLFKLEIEENASKKNVTGIRNSHRLEKCVELTGNCAINPLELEGKEISHGDSSFPGSNTAAQSEEGLNTREAEEGSVINFCIQRTRSTICLIWPSKYEKSEYGAMKLEEDFSFCHQRSFGSLVLQCIEAFGKVFIACSSVLFCYMYLPLLALLLLIPSSNGLSTEKPKMDCLSRAQVVDIKIKLDAQATCNTQEIPISCENGELAVCLHIVFENVMAWGCAPNICINGQVCAEFRKTLNGLYVVQGGRNCKSCPRRYRLSQLNKVPECYNMTEPNPSSTMAPATGNNTMAPAAEKTQTLSSEATVGIVIGVALVVILIAAIVCCYCIRRKKCSTCPNCLSLCESSCVGKDTNKPKEEDEERQGNPLTTSNESNGTVQLQSLMQEKVHDID